MNKYVHLWKYRAQFSKVQKFQTRRREIKKNFMFSNLPPLKSCLLWDNVEKYCAATQATDDNIILRMRFMCHITKATDTHSGYVILE